MNQAATKAARLLLGLALAGSAIHPQGFANPPAAVQTVFRNIVEALSNQDTDQFLDQFDPETPGLANIRFDVAGALSAQGVPATIEFVGDRGDESRRELRLDWYMRIGTASPTRRIVECVVERRDGRWKITQWTPRDLFSSTQ